MPTLTEYTPEEQETLRYAPLWTFSQVAGADQDIDEKEFQALAKELSEAPLYKNHLVREVLGSIASDFGSALDSYKADSRKVDEGLRDVADILDAKAGSEDSDAFRRAMVGIGVEVAKASGSRFGDKVSENEKVALAIVANSLRFSLS